MTAFIKYLFLFLVSLGIFVLAVFDVNAEDLMYKGGIILAFLVGLFILNIFAKLAWKLLMLIVFVTVILYGLNYFGLLEFSSDSLNNIYQHQRLSENSKK